ncbi:MAG TPA: BTAD domain-containing putative transcriptional regulator [Candidatus Sulfomarinibacteraceae bacterium]|nr:BTAD domain-containing putative transcriptional regulator [Candidatus Sulfomarinibacteraceae bacterium]
MRTLYVDLLGDFSLLYGDEPVTSFFQGRLQALLAYLLLHREAPQSRQRMAFLFWPDSGEHHARNSLRQLLFQLRRSLPAAEQFVQIETKTVQWRVDAPFVLDVLDFEGDLELAALAAKEKHTLLERTALESAVRRYRGELLPSCYDEWLLPERERLRRAHTVAMERLIVLAETQRDYAAAIEHAERLLRHDPLHETTYRRLMRLHALRHDRASALRVYHKCITVLERELGVEPNAETQETYRRLLNMKAPLLLNPPPSSFLAAATGPSFGSEALFDAAAAHDDLPPDLYDKIQVRLRYLSPPALELACLAATIGQTFAADLLARASSTDEAVLAGALEELKQQGIVREQEPGTYVFSQDEIRKVAYLELSPGRRSAHHRRVAMALEQRHAANLDVVNSQIAIHYEHAGSKLLAAAYYVRAAVVAEQTGRQDHVIRLLSKVSALLPVLPALAGGERDTV